MDHPSLGDHFPRRWFVRSILGWTLGIVLAVLLAVGGDVAGIEGVQTLVGVGVGLGVGLLQAPVLRPWLGSPRRWIGATAAGLAAPFVVADVLHAISPVPYSLPVCVVFAGVLVGVLQARLLRPHLAATRAWVVASVGLWSAAGAVVSATDLLRDRLPRGVPGLVTILALWLCGGVFPGLAGRLLERPRPA